jgi:hypothetical protein
MSRRAAALVLAFAVVASHPSLAQDAPSAETRKPIQAYGADHPACREWTDGCVVCRRGAEEGEPACSLAGIACAPGGDECLRSR